MFFCVFGRVHPGILGLARGEDDIDDRDALLDQFQAFSVTTILQRGHRQLYGFGIFLGLATVAGSQGFAVLLAVIPKGNVKDG